MNNSWINVKLWIGEEQEGNEKGKLRLFVDGAGYSDIVSVLEKYPEIEAVYFGHEIDWETVRRLVNKVRIIVEVDDLSKIPVDMMGRVEVVYRIPNWVDYVKTVKKDKIYVVSLEDGKVNQWDGRKVYREDKVVL